MDQDLFFNVLTFDWPKEPVTLYFSNESNDRCQDLYFSLFPNEAESLFPGLVRNSTNTLHTTFGYPAEGMFAMAAVSYLMLSLMQCLNGLTAFMLKFEL